MIHSKQDLKYYLQQDRIANNVTSSKLKLWMRNFVDSSSIYNFLKTLRYTEYYTNNDSVFYRMMAIVYKIRLQKITKRLGYSTSFYLGDENTKSCTGCYWNDPKEFNKNISENFVKEDE